MAGAFVAGQETLVETLIQNARTYIYTTATPPMLAHALLTSLNIIEQEDWRRKRLYALIAQLREGLAAARWPLLPSATGKVHTLLAVSVLAALKPT